MVRRFGKYLTPANTLLMLLTCAFLQVAYWPSVLLQPLVWIDHQLNGKIYDFSAQPNAVIPLNWIQVPASDLAQFSSAPEQSDLAKNLHALSQKGTLAVFLTTPFRYPRLDNHKQSAQLDSAMPATENHWALLQQNALWVLPEGFVPTDRVALGDGATDKLRWRGRWAPRIEGAFEISGDGYQFSQAANLPAHALIWRQGAQWHAGIPLSLMSAHLNRQLQFADGVVVDGADWQRVVGADAQLPVDVRLQPKPKTLAAALSGAQVGVWLVSAASDPRPGLVAATLQTLAANQYPKSPAWGQWFAMGMVVLLSAGMLGWWLSAAPWVLTLYGLIGAAALIACQWAAQVYLQWRLPVGTGLLLLVCVWSLRLAWWCIELPFRGVLVSWRDAWQQIVRRQLQDGQLEAAELHLTSLASCRPESWQLQLSYDVAQTYEKQRRYEQAEKLYRSILARSGRFADVQGRLRRLQELSSGQAGAGLDATLVIDEQIINKPVLGRYEIQKELGRGAMGVVYLARDPRIGRMVAVKTLHYKHFESNQLEGVKARFFREAEAAGRLSHPNIVSVFDVGEEADLAYIAMDFVPGRALNFYCAPDKLLPVHIVYGLIAKAADALFYAHKHQIVHRDIKPSNLLYDADTGRMKVSDFGIARLVDNSKTRTGDVMGSPLYMSPEQLKGAKVGESADIYSLGVTMYQLLTGKLPYDGDSLANLTYNILQGKHPSVRSHRPDLPASATRITNKALQKEPADRYLSGKEMADALRKSLARDF
ncbi:serine/threonine-protein kinase [Simiduia aestuariiviva]|uniref:Serine/threonine-protein kinase n=1 Tax=Simiduia aestuariiviva TaxID=1510459 RepID=A0A839URH9_9GAMM|nr:serine/threonine-protein kinase [Simiduia aestuariiviva]MBB3167985.1 serine/threonine-protein kinase [Simiduia aestuariiviva]